MKLRYYGGILLLILLAGLAAILLLVPSPMSSVDVAEINDVSATLTTQFDELDELAAEDAVLPASSYDYAVVDAEGRLLKATSESISHSVAEALRNGDAVVDLMQGEELVGRVIFATNAEAQWQGYQNALRLSVVLVLVSFVAAGAVFLWVLHRKVVRPFDTMRRFAGRMAAGELDLPLEMDRSNTFGAFTESFDLMRSELKRAREGEYAAEQSKRELVASLSHDIQTPVASIKAVAELMEVSAGEAERQKLQTIQEKAGQIQNLVTDLFHTTLEELDSLSVQPVPLPSTNLAEIVKAADYQNRVVLGEIPRCLVLADPVRLAQVLDNLIANSYKYAGTSIEVTFAMGREQTRGRRGGEQDAGRQNKNEHSAGKQSESEQDAGDSSPGGTESLIITLRDFGPGAAPEELVRLTSKYFRGKVAEGKSGYGLGLFIAQRLTERMGGTLECSNAHPGFTVRIQLPLA